MGQSYRGEGGEHVGAVQSKVQPLGAPPAAGNWDQNTSYELKTRRVLGCFMAPFASHSLLAMVLPSWLMEHTDISLSTLVTLPLRPLASPPPPPPSIFVSQECGEAGPPWDLSPSRNTPGLLWMLSAVSGKEKERTSRKRRKYHSDKAN